MASQHQQLKETALLKLQQCLQNLTQMPQFVQLLQLIRCLLLDNATLKQLQHIIKAINVVQTWINNNYKQTNLLKKYVLGFSSNIQNELQEIYKLLGSGYEQSKPLWQDFLSMHCDLPQRQFKYF